MDNTLSSYTIGLACAALHPGLRNILIFDSDIEDLTLSSKLLGEMIEVTEKQDSRVLLLGAYNSEDELWGNLSMSPENCNQTEEEDVSIIWQKGSLLPSKKDELIFILIPDLSRITLDIARSCIMLMDSPKAYLERHGQQIQWDPQYVWIASCERENIGQVSPHLLDRFYVRLQPNIKKEMKPETKIMQLLKSKEKPENQKLTDEFRAKIMQAFVQKPEITGGGIERILEFISESKYYSNRRDIALGRLSYAFAKLNLLSQVTESVVEQAAQILNLLPNEQLSETLEGNINEDSYSGAESLNSGQPSEGGTVKAPVFEEAIIPDGNIQPTVEILDENNPWPEDFAPLEREEGSLRIPHKIFHKKEMSRKGIITGVQKATKLEDLAITSTIFEAARYQPIRKLYSAKKGIILSPNDLQSYRRIPPTTQLLILLLDYTCLAGCKWEEAISPYLWWAYINRASVCLVQVGAVTSRSEYRAERSVERSILSYRFNKLIGAEPGKATPLAHGFELILVTLEETIKNGSSNYREAVVVILTDGRGNIPIKVSHSGEMRGVISREGIDDALCIARKLSLEKKVHFVVLDPQPEEYPYLPKEFADTLKAELIFVNPAELV